MDPLKPEGQVELSKNLQITTAAVDSTGLCLFVAFPVMDLEDGIVAVVDMLNAKFGLSLTTADVGTLGQRVLSIERDFNTRAGFNEADDRLPDFFLREKLSPHDVVFDVPNEELDTVYKF